MRIAAAALLALTACGPTDDSADTDLNLPQDETECGAYALRYLEGEPRESFDFDEIDGEVRILHPDAIVTQDYNPKRLNVHVGKSGIISKLTCG
ncbi:Peptidase inhibitor I78 family protein [Roseovarius albus]|uniref:Peptidase inhibitor I78 family protein n=1 Tax=Roseovarius albus TaxID=1247867 RepID=A0A1X6YVJ4_9RHOB|nr:I78 family peptidase inhibitor [Roseovarius albus]SLN31822.1 Peptidase inhibitor I78 family protein [Roseovarius albus]